MTDRLTGLGWRKRDLFASDILARCYAKDTLRSDLARHCFVLPKPS
jgi:hypothetical protein